MELKIHTQLVKNIISSIITKIIKEKVGPGIDIRLEDFNIQPASDSKCIFNISVTGSASYKDIENLILKK